MPKLTKTPLFCLLSIKETPNTFGDYERAIWGEEFTLDALEMELDEFAERLFGGGRYFEVIDDISVGQDGNIRIEVIDGTIDHGGILCHESGDQTYFVVPDIREKIMTIEKPIHYYVFVNPDWSAYRWVVVEPAGTKFCSESTNESTNTAEVKFCHGCCGACRYFKDRAYQQSSPDNYVLGWCSHLRMHGLWPQDPACEEYIRGRLCPNSRNPDCYIRTEVPEDKFIICFTSPEQLGEPKAHYEPNCPKCDLWF